MVVRRAIRGIAIALVAVPISWPVWAADNTPGPASGSVLLLKHTNAQFDRYTLDPTQAVKSWIDDHFWRMLVYSPYFDTRTSWYGRGWIYIDSYAIYTNPDPWSPDILHSHPDWVLHDAAGQTLYIPWGCNGVTCPQAAADVGNAAYRRWWTDSALDQLARGKYAGIFIDDVNMDWRVGDASGKFAAPIDTTTGAPMTEDTWRNNFATFLEGVRHDLPGVELVHNAVWYAGGRQRQSNAAIQRQIGAADWIEIEHGVNDSGLTGGTGPYALQTLFGYIDSVHKLGRSVIIGEAGGPSPTPASLEYALACYFLVGEGRDALGDGGNATPDSWWTGFEVQLGAPLGPRADWYGLMRRDFAGGMVVVNEPGNRRVSLMLPGTFTRLDSNSINRISLGAGEGVVLRH